MDELTFWSSILETIKGNVGLTLLVVLSLVFLATLKTGMFKSYKLRLALLLGFFLLAAGVSGYVLWQDAAGKRQAGRIQRPIGDARIPPPVQHSQRGN